MLRSFQYQNYYSHSLWKEAKKILEAFSEAESVSNAVKPNHCFQLHVSEGAKTQARSGQVHFHFTREAFKVLQQSYCKEIQSTTFLIHNFSNTKKNPQLGLLFNILHHIQGKKCSPTFYVVRVFCLYLWCYHNTECLLVSNSRLDKTRKLMTSKLWFHFNFWHLINQKRH